MSSRPLSNRAKPTTETKFHIDYSWWKRDDRDLRSTLIKQLPPEMRTQFEGQPADELIDWVDPETAEVRQIDGLQHTIARAAKDPHFINERTPLVDAVFRVFLANGNKPLSPEELSKHVGRPAQTILRALAGTQVYNGIRPHEE